MREAVLELLREKDKWLVISHEKPDGDTLGCGAALTRLGGRISKDVLFACMDPCPDKYSFLLDGLNLAVLDRMPENFGHDGVIICVDTSTMARSLPGLAGLRGTCPIINIDHHTDNERYGDLNWIEPEASATGEMVTELLSSSPWGLTGGEASALYVAMISDNGSFSFASTTLRSHRCAMKLLEAGVSPNLAAEELESNLSPGVLSLWGRAMTRTVIFADSRCAVYWLSKEDFLETGTSRGATENLVNFLMRIKGVKLAALCSEFPPKDGEADAGVRVSIRSRPPFKAREVAAEFGGGGHDLASGCTIAASVEETLSLIRDEMERHVSGYSGDR
ncbi:MAG: bifunctional oligoribonuclease/PAP phosphatase NrnA [Synergistaceae bacterium]|nr:bifunctional oligoribonuclease/PAP phosphatase NrnA [Synergistaceae bacterium]